MNSQLQSQFDRAEELLKELEQEYNNALNNKKVTDKAINLTHEVLSKIRAIFDQAMYQYFSKKIAPSLTIKENQKAKVYFPITNSENSLRSTLGRGMMSDLKSKNPTVYNLLKSVQPYTNNSNRWLKLLNQFSVKGKHICLIPQKRKTQKRISVRNASGSQVSWDPNCVKFGSGSKIFGAPVDPTTQNIIPTPGVESKKEIWVSFNFEGTNINALGLCKEVIQKSKNLIADFMKLF